MVAFGVATIATVATGGVAPAVLAASGMTVGTGGVVAGQFTSFKSIFGKVHKVQSRKSRYAEIAERKTVTQLKDESVYYVKASVTFLTTSFECT